MSALAEPPFMDTNTPVNSEVQDWMSPAVVTIERTHPVREVLALMKENRVSAVPVLDAHGKIVGIVTVGDFARVVFDTEQLLESDYPHFEDCLWAVDLVQKRFGTDEAMHLMTEVVATVAPTQTMAEAAHLMMVHHVRHLPVVSRDGELVGMLSANDFVRMAAPCDSSES